MSRGGRAEDEPVPGEPSRFWAGRYGGSEPVALLAPERWNEVLRTQLGHRSVRSFTTEPVAEELLTTLLVAAQSAPTSSHLQAWSVVVVRDPDRKTEAARLCGEQQFVVEAPVFLLWVLDHARAHQQGEAHGVELAATDHLDLTLVGAIDTALAAQNAVVAAESLGLGTVYVGAARDHPEELAELVGLPPRSVVVFGLALGHPDPTRPAAVKPRLPLAAVVHQERYDAAGQAEHVAEHERVMSAFYTAQGLPGGWVRRVLRRLGPDGIAGRAGLADAFRSRGIGLD